jgi:hypothetical protein
MWNVFSLIVIIWFFQIIHQHNLMFFTVGLYSLFSLFSDFNIKWKRKSLLFINFE